jgi:hypothetical protein
MHKLVLLLVALLTTPVAAAPVPHVELAVMYRPVPGAPNSGRLMATNAGPGHAYIMSYHGVCAARGEDDGQMASGVRKTCLMNSSKVRSFNFQCGRPEAVSGGT